MTAAARSAVSVGSPGSSAAWPSEIRLRNQVGVSIRAVTLDDEPAIFAFLTGLSIASRRLRFFTAAVDLRAEAHRGAAGDDSDHHGILALAPERGVVGHAIYVRVPDSERAEVAVEVADDLHRLGLATMLLIRLARLAESRQISHFFAEVLPENRDMLTIFSEGFGAATVARRGEMDIEFATSNWRLAQAGIDR
jgi:GNAT superfamily N-acetyltransferase